MLVLNKDNFKAEVLESKTPVLVDFWAIGCGPCRSLKPILEGLEAKTSSDQGIRFATIEASDAMDVFGTYSVGRVPTMIIFKDGKDVDRKGGLMSEKDITEWLNSKVK